MRGRPRLDGPGARMKFTRDWEYPWALLRASAGPGRRLLDCGAGYSPLPFLWAARGATVHAIDRDALIASPLRYLAWCVARMFGDLAAELQPRRRAASAAAIGPAPARRPADAARARIEAGTRSGGAIGRFVRFHTARNRERFSRMARPDFWGPVSPRLLRRYGVRYINGDLMRLPFPAGRFDAVSCISVLEHMPRDTRLAGVREMARVTKRGGRLIITYDVVDGDITDEIVAAAGGSAVERVYFHASARLYASRAPDVIGIVIDM